jgi:hypothetical protein
MVQKDTLLFPVWVLDEVLYFYMLTDGATVEEAMQWARNVSTEDLVKRVEQLGLGAELKSVKCLDE